MGGDYLRYQQFYRAAVTDVTASTSADPTTTTGGVLARKTNHTLYIQKINVATTVDSSATLLFVDSSTTAPKSIAKTKASPGLGPIVPFDFGPTGIPLTEGEGLDITASAIGLAGTIHVEGYYKLTKGAADVSSSVFSG